MKKRTLKINDFVITEKEVLDRLEDFKKHHGYHKPNEAEMDIILDKIIQHVEFSILDFNEWDGILSCNTNVEMSVIDQS